MGAYGCHPARCCRPREARFASPTPRICRLDPHLIFRCPSSNEREIPAIYCAFSRSFWRQARSQSTLPVPSADKIRLALRHRPPSWNCRGRRRPARLSWRSSSPSPRHGSSTTLLALFDYCSTRCSGSNQQHDRVHRSNRNAGGCARSGESWRVAYTCTEADYA